MAEDAALLSSDGLSIGSRYLVSLCHAIFLLFLNIGLFQVNLPPMPHFHLMSLKILLLNTHTFGAIGPSLQEALGATAVLMTMSCGQI